MSIDDNANYYDVLEVKPDASPQELRDAYLRLKGAYSKNSVALYTLFSKEETEGMLRRIEDAYLILSHPEKRREYDRNHGLSSETDQMIDRFKHVSPHERIITSPAPSTQTAPAFDPSEDPLIAPRLEAPASAQQQHAPVTMPSPSPAISRQQPAPQRAEDPAIEADISGEKEWSGAFLRRVREARRLSVEEISEQTKISKTYIRAIEDEDFTKLPAAVFVRGFMVQICKMLRLSGDDVAKAFLARYRAKRPEP